ncbi:DNA (cytosine-5-)-methyltransferase [Candidatus Saccharibacteria bacterium]|nr:DNA (cytosine-5-)-methyltransferase [Candidatus Saccharibacteria bacterium]
MSALLTISDAAIKVGVSTDTIRRWEKKGLIKSQRSESNYRLFELPEIQNLYKKISGDHSINLYKILRSSKRTNYTVIDLFSGAGGTALGLDNAGLNHILLNEFDKSAAETLTTNRKDWDIICDDIKNINFHKYKGSADIVEGGFPCQAFSYAGRKMGFEDARGTLFYEFARVVKEVQPKIAIGENVKGLLRHNNGETLKAMLEVLSEIGYRAEYKVLRSQYLDVPQKRERLVIIAVRDDLDLPIIYPEEKNYTISIHEAIGDKPEAPGQSYAQRKKEIMKLVPEGGYWRDLPDDVQIEYMKASYGQTGGKTGMARRLSWHEPSLTLTCTPAQKQTERCHPEETRPLNVREYARIQTFPDSWKFSGSVSAQYKQIGNAVPVNLGYHIGTSVINILNGNAN